LEGLINDEIEHMNAGLAGGAESILIPESKTDINQVINKIEQGIERGKLHSIIIVAQGFFPPFDLRAIIEATTSNDIRVSILGHMQSRRDPQRRQTWFWPAAWAKP